MRLNKNSFTLTELIIVVVIISILASIAIPTIVSVKKKAIATEAIAALGTIRTAAKLYYLERGAYCDVSTLISTGYLGSGNLDGTYFSEFCYRRLSISNPVRTYFICQPGYSEAPRKDEVLNWRSGAYIAMDDAGNLYSNVDELGLPSAEFGTS